LELFASLQEELRKTGIPSKTWNHDSPWNEIEVKNLNIPPFQDGSNGQAVAHTLSAGFGRPRKFVRRQESFFWGIWSKTKKWRELKMMRRNGVEWINGHLFLELVFSRSLPLTLLPSHLRFLLSKFSSSV
jgi:hypothetical protein